jgi:hypothetical protein
VCVCLLCVFCFVFVGGSGGFVGGLTGGCMFLVVGCLGEGRVMIAHACVRTDFAPVAHPPHFPDSTLPYTTRHTHTHTDSALPFPTRHTHTPKKKQEEGRWPESYDISDHGFLTAQYTLKS